MDDAERMSRRNWIVALSAVVAVATLAGGLYGGRLLGAPVESVLQERLKEYTEILEAAEYWAPEAVTSDKMVYASIDGMMKRLDPHSSFLEPRDYADMQDRQKGTFYGLGILVTKRNDQVTVITPLEGTPAARLGIRAGDIIAEVEGTPTDDLPLDEVVRRLKGAKGTPVNIAIRRIGIDELIPLTIIREAIPTNSVSYALMVRPDVGYIRIKDFTYTTVRELDQAIETLQKQGMKKLVLDLRMNPGGLLDSAVGVSDHFLDKGQMVVYTKGRTPDSFQEYTAPGKHDPLNIPLVILVNHGSASASEIVAGAIQDHDRGLVVGETTWGKGLVQSVYTLPYGAGLALTTARYYTPAGRNIQRDYSSIYDYYLSGLSDSDVPADVPADQRESFKTDTGRSVLGGGGITPDHVMKPGELARVVQILEVRSGVFNYAVEYVAAHPDVKRTFEVTPAIMEDFVRYVSAKDIAPLEELRKAMANPPDRIYVERALRAEIAAARFGYDASYAIRLEGDEQLAKAIALLPEAKKLAEAARALSEQIVSGERDGMPDAAAASKLPSPN